MRIVLGEVDVHAESFDLPLDDAHVQSVGHGMTQED